MTVLTVVVNIFPHSFLKSASGESLSLTQSIPLQTKSVRTRTWDERKLLWLKISSDNILQIQNSVIAIKKLENTIL